MKRTIWFLIIKFFLVIFAYITYSLLQNSNKYYFYNYDQFISERIEKEIADNYGFKSFGDTNGLEAQIDQHKVLGAISSDYHIKKLIKEKKLAKIDYKKIFPNENKTVADFKNLYIDAIKKHGEKKIIDIDNEEHDIFDYTIPYYYQYKVIAFDIRRAKPQLVRNLLKERNKDIINSDHRKRIKDLISYIDNDEKKWWKNFTNKDISEYLLKDIDGKKIDGQQEYKQYFGILEEIGLKNIVINDYTRDVLYIGASKDKNQEEIAKLENKDYETNFKSWINNFIDNISSYKENGNIYYTENGTEALTYLSDPNSQYNVAVMYNGDAFDAFNHGDQFKNNNGDNYFIRVIRPKNNFGIFDGLIMPAYIKEDPYYENKFYEIVRNYFIGWSFDKLKNPNLEDDQMEDNPLYENYDFARFNTAYKEFNKKVCEKFKSEYEDADKQDDHKNTIIKNAEDIFDLNADYNYLESLTNNLFAQVSAYYKTRKFAN